MATIPYEIPLYIDHPQQAIKFRLQQNDVNSLQIIITIYEDNEEFIIPIGYPVYLRMLKPDNKVVYNECSVVNNKAIFNVTAQMTAMHGRASAQLEIIDPVSGGNVKTIQFHALIDEEVISDSQIESSNEFTALQSMAIYIADFSTRMAQIGDLAQLNTTSNTDLVSSINENTTRIKNIAVNVKDYGAKGDGVTDDSTAINNAINAVYGLGGGSVIIPSGHTFIVNSQINMKSNIRLIIDGTLKLKADGSAHIIMISQCSNVIIEGIGTIDGNRSTLTTSEPLAGIYTVNSSHHLTIRDITIKSCNNWTVNIVNSHNVLLDNLTLSDSLNSAEFANGCYNCHARNIEVFGLGDYGFAFYGGVYNSSIVDSYIHDNVIDGIVVLSDGGQASVCHDITISGNTVCNNSYSGISTRIDLTGNYAHENIIINANNLHHNNKANIGGLGGIWVQVGNKITVANNVIHEDGNGTNSSVGINLAPQTKAVKYVSIIGNIITNEGQGSGLGVGIQVGGLANNINISGNTLEDTQTTKTTAYQINIIGGDNVSIKNNNLGLALGSKINYGASIVGKMFWISENNGYNPLGKVESPSVPATDVSYVNNFGMPMRVYVSLGTVSNIIINNAYVHMTSGTFILYPLETIAISYTVAPVWNWYAI